MKVLAYATRDDLEEAAELRRRLQQIHTLAVCVIKTQRGLSASKKRALIEALDRELQGD